MPKLWSEPRHASSADLAACRTLLRGGSRSFHLAAKMLPARVHVPAGAIYAFCRQADDEIDHSIEAKPGAHPHPTTALAGLYQRLDAAYAGRPHPSPVDRAFADVVRDHHMPRALPEALLEGFAWDAAGRTYESLSDVLAYAARVAGSVGAMMAVLMRCRDPVGVARACDLGVAMQLSNIARDVGEDARAGRLYLPRAWLRQEGIDAERFLVNPAFTPELGRVVARLLDVADSLYRRADAGISGLPLSCRPGIGAARRLYAEIGHEVLRRDGDSIASRAVVPGRRKLALLARSCAASLVRHPANPAQPLSETAFLVEAVRDSTPRFHRAPTDSRLGWTIELFARLDDRRQATR